MAEKKQHNASFYGTHYNSFIQDLNFSQNESQKCQSELQFSNQQYTNTQIQFDQSFYSEGAEMNNGFSQLQKSYLKNCILKPFEKKLRDYKLEVNEQIMLMFEKQSANIAKKIDEKFQILLKRLDNKIDEFKNQVSSKMSQFLGEINQNEEKSRILYKKQNKRLQKVQQQVSSLNTKVQETNNDLMNFKNQYLQGQRRLNHRINYIEGKVDSFSLKFYNGTIIPTENYKPGIKDILISRSAPYLQDPLKFEDMRINNYLVIILQLYKYKPKNVKNDLLNMWEIIKVKRSQHTYTNQQKYRLLEFFELYLLKKQNNPTNTKNKLSMVEEALRLEKYALQPNKYYQFIEMDKEYLDCFNVKEIVLGIHKLQDIVVMLCYQLHYTSFIHRKDVRKSLYQIMINLFLNENNLFICGAILLFGIVLSLMKIHGWNEQHYLLEKHCMSSSDPKRKYIYLIQAILEGLKIQ